MVSVFAPVREMTADEFRRVTEVNYLGYVHGTLAALRHMRARNRGVIIQMGSALAYRFIPLQSAYCASKAAIRGFTDSLRCELIHERSRVHAHDAAAAGGQHAAVRGVRNRLPEHAQPVPPIYQPEVIARAAVRAAPQARRAVWIGWSAIKAIIGQRPIPGALDSYLAKNAWTSQETENLPPGHPPQHDLGQPRRRTLPGDRGAHGPFGSRARTFTSELAVRRSAPWLAVAAAAVAIGWAVRQDPVTTLSWAAFAGTS